MRQKWLFLFLFMFVLIPAVNASCSAASFSILQQDLYTEQEMNQQANLTIRCNTSEELAKIIEASVAINLANVPGLPRRGYLTWTPARGFRENAVTNNGNTYLKLLTDQSFTQSGMNDTDVFATYFFTWKIQLNYGDIPLNNVSYYWLQNGSNGIWKNSAALFSVHTPPLTQTPIYHILSTGQSLSIGSTGTPALSTTQPYTNKMLNSTDAYFMPLVETNVETKSSAMANTITSLVPNNDYEVEVTRHGKGGYQYSQLRKGTTQYNLGMDQLNMSRDIAQGMGKPYTVIAVTAVHGESDHVNGTGDDYEQDLVEWQSDYENDIHLRTGQNETIPFFTDQMSSFTHYGNSTSRIPMAQLAAAENNPGKIYLIGPKYFFNYTDGLHLNNKGYRLLGEYYGKVMKKVIIDKEPWLPLSPLAVQRQGDVITVPFHVPQPPLQIDTERVLAKENYGFEYYENTSMPANITSVTITGPDTITITLNQVPTGLNERLRYAYTGTPYAYAGAFVAGSARGNIRDNDTTPSINGNDLFNWLVQFDKPITVLG